MNTSTLPIASHYVKYSHSHCTNCKDKIPCSLKNCDLEILRRVINCLNGDDEDSDDNTYRESDDSGAESFYGSEEEEEEEEEEEKEEEKDNTGTITHSAFVRKSILGQTNKQLVQEKARVPVDEFLKIMLAEIKTYETHHQLATNQTTQYRQFLDTLPRGHFGVFMDFSAKFINQSFEAFQEAVFGQIKTSILVCVVASVSGGTVAYNTQFYISPVNKQDSQWVICAIENLHSKVLGDSPVHYWCDGASHFHNRFLLNCGRVRSASISGQLDTERDCGTRRDGS